MATMQQYRSSYPPQGPPGRSPHAAPARRGPGPMLGHPQAQMNPANVQAQQLQMQQEREMAKRRSRKPTDKTIPDGVEDLVIGNGVETYKALRDIEKRLDAAMMRKKLDMSDSVNREVQRYKTLRVWVSNTVENQLWQQTALDENAFDFSSEHVATFRVKIEGRLLDDDIDNDNPTLDSDDEDEDTKESEKDTNAMDEDTTAPTTKKIKATPPRRHFSDFFKSVNVEFDGRTPAASSFKPVEWRKSAPGPPGSAKSNAAASFDAIEFERKSDENINCTVNLSLLESPERFKLSPELAEVLDATKLDRASAVMGIWEYVKAMNLQEDEEKRGVRCDDRLRAIFKQETIFFPSVPELLAPHLSPLPPLSIPYTIRVDQAFHSSPDGPEPTIYDIRVPLDDPLRSLMNSALHNTSQVSSLREIMALDDQLALFVHAIGQSKAKHGFLSAAAAEPAAFMHRWHGSQSRDLATLMGESGRGIEEAGLGDEWRRGGNQGVWGSEEARETVAYYLSRPERQVSR